MSWAIHPGYSSAGSAALAAIHIGVEGAGEIFSANFDAGNLTAFDSVDQTGATVLASTTQHRSGGYSAAFTGNGTDNRGTLTKTFGSTQGTGSRSYFFAMFTPTGSLKASTSLRMEMQSSGSGVIGPAINTNSSGNVSAIQISHYVSPNQLGGTFAVSNWAMDAWNTVELRLTTGTFGVLGIYVNGLLVNSSTASDLSSASYTGINKFIYGCNAFGVGQVNGGTVYLDDIKVSANPISAALN